MNTQLWAARRVQKLLPGNLRLSGKCHCSDMPERSLINERCEHCSKNLDSFSMETPCGKFRCPKCVRGEVSYKNVNCECTLIQCLRWVVDNNSFSFLSFFAANCSFIYRYCCHKYWLKIVMFRAPSRIIHRQTCYGKCAKTCFHPKISKRCLQLSSVQGCASGRRRANQN